MPPRAVALAVIKRRNRCATVASIQLFRPRQNGRELRFGRGARLWRQARIEELQVHDFAEEARGRDADRQFSRRSRPSSGRSACLDDPPNLPIVHLDPKIALRMLLQHPNGLHGAESGQSVFGRLDWHSCRSAEQHAPADDNQFAQVKIVGAARALE